MKHFFCMFASSFLLGVLILVNGCGGGGSDVGGSDAGYYIETVRIHAVCRQEWEIQSVMTDRGVFAVKPHILSMMEVGEIYVVSYRFETVLLDRMPVIVNARKAGK